MKFRVVYDAGLGIESVWEKSLDDLLTPNGEDTLLVWLLKEQAKRGRYIRVETIDALVIVTPRGEQS